MMYQYEEDMNKIYDLMRVHNDWMRDSVNLIASEKLTKLKTLQNNYPVKSTTVHTQMFNQFLV